MTKLTDDVVPKSLRPPPRLYHYTTQKGLIGILESRSIWATQIQYLNDSTEFTYTLGLWKNALEVRRRRAEGAVLEPALKSELISILDAYHKPFEGLSKIRLHVACFCESGDELSQWRGYCHPCAGYSIGFESSQLIEAAARQSCFLAPCIYDPTRQAQLVGKLLGESFASALRGDDKPLRESSYDNTLDYVFLASLLKHPSFKDEREWRLVTQEVPATHPQIAIRQGTTTLIPHFALELVKPTEQLNVEVIVGPNPEMNLAIESTNTLLKMKNCVGSSRPSVVPYREI